MSAPSTAKKIVHVVMLLVSCLLVAIAALIHDAAALGIPAVAIAVMTDVETLLAVLKGAGSSFGASVLLIGFAIVGAQLSLAAALSSCTATQGQFVKAQVIDCGKGALGNEVGQAVGAAAAAITSGAPAGAVAKGIAIGAGVNAIDFGVCVLSKLEADLAGKAFQDGAPAGAQVAVVLDAYLAEHPGARAKTYDVSRVAVVK